MNIFILDKHNNFESTYIIIRETYLETWFSGGGVTHVPLGMNSLVKPIPLQVGFWIQSFPSPRLVGIPRLKSSVYPTIYP